MRRILFVFLASIFACLCNAQGVDGVRAGLFASFGSMRSKIIYAQDAVTTAQIGTHVIYQKDVKQIVNLQKEFNNYIDSVREVLQLAAQTYGIFNEVKNTINGLNKFKEVSTHVMQHQTTNLVAVAYSQQGKAVYRDIVDTGIQLAGDIKLVLPFGKNKSKMTHFERIECLSRIRQNIHKVNTKIWMACNLLKYTTLLDTWYEVTQSTKPLKKTRPLQEIIKDAREAWVRNAQGANKYNSN